MKRESQDKECSTLSEREAFLVKPIFSFCKHPWENFERRKVGFLQIEMIFLFLIS